MDTIATRYASALFDLAKEENKIDEYQEQVKMIAESLNMDPSIQNFLSHYSITDEEKKKVLSSAFNKGFEKNILNFIRLLIDKKRIGLWVEIARCFNSLCNNHKGIMEGIVYSTKPLNKKDLAAIEKVVGERYQKIVSLDNKIDLNLISGVKVFINDEMIDGSLKNRIENLKEELIEKAGKI